jgi:FKBP-type peptidyl-prolyl cis-trans isomerase 2
MSGVLEPGMLVRHPGQADWGLGQVQSVIEPRVTVNFEHAGKVVIDMRHIALVPEFGRTHPSCEIPPETQP